MVMLLLTTVSQLYAQQKVTGTIKDDSNAPLPGATVYCYGDSKNVATNPEGKFSIDISHSPDTLIITCTGFITKRCLVSSGQSDLDVIMQKETVMLSEVVVSSRQVEGQLMQMDINKTPVNTAQDLLRKVPGLFIAQHAGGGKAEQIFLRGFDNDHGTDIAITADGMPVNVPSHAHGQGYSDLHFLIPETIANIDFGKGPYYTDKGDFNTSGYVDFHTLEKVENSMIKVEGGNFNTARMAGVFKLTSDKDNASHRNAYIAGEYNYTKGPFDVNQDFNRVNLMGKYNQRIGPHSYINVQASAFTSKWNASGQIPERAVIAGIIDRFGSIDSTEGGNTTRINVIADYIHKINDTQEWKSKFYYSHYLFNLYSDFTFYLVHPDKGDEIKQYDNRDVYGMNHSYIHHFFMENTRFDWESGIGVRYDNIHDLELSYVTARDVLNERMAWGSAKEANANAYTSLELTTGRWRVNGGVRADWFYFYYDDKLEEQSGKDNYQKAKVSPKLSVFYSLSDNVSLYLKTGIGFHSNDVRDVILQKGGNVLPYASGLDLGAVIRPAKDLILRPVLWYLQMSDEYVWNGDEYGVSNVGATRRVGADLSVRYQPLSFLYFDADVNWARPRLINALKNDNYVELAPTLTSTGGVGIQTKGGLNFNLRYRYMHDRPASQDGNIIANGYFVNDLLVGYQKGKWGVNVQVQNLFNVKWNEAMFAETTRLKGEPAEGIEELTFTPGTPLSLKGGIVYKF